MVSPDGRQTAFAREHNIVITDKAGAVVAEHPFRVSGDVSGMRFIESLSWLTDHELLVGGSVNPSTVEYVVVDSRTGKEMRGYLVDGFAIQPSPNGRHIAYQGYIPHFTPENEKRSQFCIDKECEFYKQWHGYPAFAGRRLEFTSNFAWSPHGYKVAVIAADADTGEAMLVVRDLSGKTSTYPMAVASTELSWSDVAAIIRR